MTSDDLERLTQAATERAGALVLYARQWLDAAGADDAVQEAVVALLAQPAAPRNPGAWLYRAVRNAAIDAARAGQRRRRREQTVAFGRREWFSPQPDALLDAKAAEESLQRLGTEHREVVVLRIWGDMGFAEIADVLQLGVSTVHDRYKAALRELRSALERPTNGNLSPTTNSLPHCARAT
jgi:RNA polymerase sigma-70 factor (ECF subfamily)